MQVLRHYGDGETIESDGDAMAATNVEESEETLPDGTVVKRRVVTTTQQQLTTERVTLEPPGDEWTHDQDSQAVDEPSVFDYSDYSGNG